jgi:hypothetical protein
MSSLSIPKDVWNIIGSYAKKDIWAIEYKNMFLGIRTKYIEANNIHEVIEYMSKYCKSEGWFMPGETDYYPVQGWITEAYKYFNKEWRGGFNIDMIIKTEDWKRLDELLIQVYNFTLKKTYFDGRGGIYRINIENDNTDNADNKI